MSRRKRGLPLSGSVVLLLLIAGCGGSSHGNPTQTTAAESTVSPPGGSSKPSSTTGPSAPQPAAASTAGAHGTVSGSAHGLTAQMHASTHHPRVGRAWPIRFTATREGHAARASVSYEYLFSGQIVANRSHYTFKGHFSDTFMWPSSAVGYPLTFRAVIVSEGVTINLEYPVQVST